MLESLVEAFIVVDMEVVDSHSLGNARQCREA